MSHGPSLAQPWRGWYDLLRGRGIGGQTGRAARFFQARRLAWPLAALAVAACGPDAGQASLCQRVLLEVEAPAEGAEIVAREEDTSAPNTVILTYRANGGDAKRRQGRVACRFAGGRFDDGRLELVGVRTDSRGELSAAAIVFLRRKLGI